MDILSDLLWAAFASSDFVSWLLFPKVEIWNNFHQAIFKANI